MTAHEPTVFFMSGSTFEMKVMLGWSFYGSGSMENEEEKELKVIVKEGHDGEDD